jgi:uncharacterized protein YbjT (DUF2867 family)
MILVTGATGHVGKELVQQLFQTGKPVRVLTRDERKVAHLDQTIERAVGDFDHAETLDRAMQGVERLFLVTDETRHDQNAIEAAKRSGVQHVVKLSTKEVLWPDLLPIGKWNLEREQLIQDSGLHWTFLRPGQFSTNALVWANSVKKANTVFFPGGKGRSAPIDPYDIAAVAAHALTEPGHEGQSYLLAGPELLTTAQQVDILGKVLGKPLRYVNVPLFIARVFMLRAGMKPELADGLVKLARVVRTGKMEQLTSTVQDVTGQAPRSFETWCRNQIAVFTN